MVSTVAQPKKPAQEKSDHGRKYRGQRSYAIPVWNGLLEHRERIGPALWEFFWCLDKITVEDEHGVGWCLGKTPIDTKRVAADLHEHENTAYENLARLTTEGYLIRKRTPRGYCIGVRNSRKFHAFHRESDSQKTMNHDSQKSVNQSASDSQKTGVVIHSFPESDSQKTVVRRDATETLQKDTTVKRVGDATNPDPSARLYIEKLKTLSDETTNTLLMRMLGKDHLALAPTFFGDIHRRFKKHADVLGVDFKDACNIYRGAMRAAEWFVTAPLGPFVIDPIGPVDEARLKELAAADPLCLNAYMVGDIAIMEYEHGFEEIHPNEPEPFWFPNEPAEETSVNVPALEHAMSAVGDSSEPSARIANDAH